MNAEKYPPNIGADDRVILFDGVCKLCNAWCQFIIKYDKQQHFKLCSVQSPEGQQILAHFNLATAHFDTMLYVEDNHYFDKSDAFFHVINKLGFPWRILSVGKIIPKRIRNWLYDRIALNRYALFGQYDTCQLPNSESDHRFLSAKEHSSR
ncbi:MULTISPECIES: thiol-disulfide oxidoreductase DCC family protein [Thalassotalea]|uniref:thiol-disulfide oxidoreductase DCC family protein n=1 Tax=Thalassotalea TaxID=1518149 RepID=UPI0009420274|nr:MULTISPECIES: DCC1-like thiol-disulfide oxidoreductase family protein [Thalassotalea]OKY25252.1 thiol-disulfide oxidoreductase [Thalassotalea sp. PP2-459]